MPASLCMVSSFWLCCNIGFESGCTVHIFIFYFCLASFFLFLHLSFFLPSPPRTHTHTLVYPVINNVSGLTEVNVSLPATLVCLTTGYPLPSITWQKEGEDVMLTMDGQISTFSFNIGNGSSSFESSEFMGNGLIEDLLESTMEFNTRDISSLGELGVVSVLSFDRLERGDTANYTCTASNMLPQTTTLTALSPSIPLVVLGMLV